MQGTIDSCHANAWVTTISGRRRYLPLIRGKGEQTAQAERQAVNTVCQGSAADIVKGVMIQLVQQLEEKDLSRHCRLLLQVGAAALHVTHAVNWLPTWLMRSGSQLPDQHPSCQHASCCLCMPCC